MINYKGLLIVLAILISFSTTCKSEIPRKREFRAIWVTTLLNLDWPSSSHLSNEKIKKECIDMLNTFQKNNINTVILQVRPSGDAIYKSDIVMWSEWITGKQGKAPKNNFDPLEFFIEECHKRCMELHAWFNPFRIVFNYRLHPANKNHISNKYRKITFRDKKHKYLNPGVHFSRSYICKVICEVVKKYDIDAVHFDDYFYPFKTNSNDNYDKKEYIKYLIENNSNLSNIHDWRRENINDFIYNLSKEIKEIKPYVKFGISPYPVWRTSKYDKLKGLNLRACSSYDELYADYILWDKMKWVDYLVPQLYGSINNKTLPYKFLANWWNSNIHNANVYAGMASYKLDRRSRYRVWRNNKEFIKQLNYNHFLNNFKGHSFFRAKPFLKNNTHIQETLLNTYHKYPAIIPTNKNIKAIYPSNPQNIRIIHMGKDNLILWNSKDKNNYYYGIYRYLKNEDPSTKTLYKVCKKKFCTLVRDEIYNYAVSAISRTNQESEIIPAKLETDLF
ncbi:MAG: family 10 glycosylhydrolase [Marinifilaceae bacterium]|jgi:uncharacterized lipoprotein YddW (UPF0748 family)|nr:family 10 glycosylhydrolase [Marinifilaceae bacterium]